MSCPHCIAATARIESLRALLTELRRSIRACGLGYRFIYDRIDEALKLCALPGGER